MATSIKISQGSSPNTIRVAAGEPIIFNIHFVNSDLAAKSLADSEFVFSVYGPGRVFIANFDALKTTDERGDIASWEIDGTYTEAWFGQALTWGINRRGKMGRDPVVSGSLTVDDSAPQVPNLASAPVGRYITRITRVDNPASATAPAFTVETVAYAATAVVPAPVFTTNPSVSGTAEVGQSLTGNGGTITGGTVSARQWLRNSTAISGATGNTYLLIGADEGARISFRVSASGAGGSIDATSAQTAVVAAAPVAAPSNSTAPAVSGSATVGSVLTSTTGTWTNSPSSYAYQWLRGGTAISGATSSSYTVVSGDQGASLTVRVTATNAGGSAFATSNAIAIPAAVTAPSNTAAPVVSGTASVGSVLTSTNGSWSNSPSIYTYAWYRDASAISGATASTYTVTSSDQGTSLTCRIIAINAGGSSSPATSNAIVIAAALPAPVNNTAPAITGNNTVGSTMTTTLGSWSNGPFGFAVSWLRDGAVISGATATSYTVVSADEGKSITSRVTATNSTASTNATSNAIAIPAAVMLQPFSTAHSNGDSRSNNSGGRAVSTSIALTYGASGYSTTGLMQPMLGNKWIWPEGFQRAIGASTTLGMVERNKTASFALTGNVAFDTTGNNFDKIFNRDSDGRFTLRDAPGKHIFQLSGVNDDGGTAGPSYYNVPFKAAKTIRDTALDLDANIAAGKTVIMANGCPTYSSSYTMELRTVTSGTWTAPQTAGFVNGNDYGAPGVVGEFTDGVRVMTRVTSNPGQDQYVVSNGSYASGGTAPTRVWVTCTAGGTSNAISPTSDHVKALWAWYNSSAANFVWNGNDYGLPGARYNRPSVIWVDSMKWLRADLNDGDTMAAKPGTMDILRLHHTPLGAFWYAKAVEEALNAAGHYASPTLDKRPARNNWYAALAGGTANPTLTWTLPPSMRMAVPTQLRLAGIVVGIVNPSTGAITTTPTSNYAITAGSINFVTGASTVTFAGTPPNGSRLHCEQDFGDGAGVGINMVLNGMMDITPLDGTNIPTGSRTGTSSVTGVSNSQVPVGYTLTAAALNTAIAAGTASVTVTSDTSEGYPMFRVAATGVHTAAGTIQLQPANSTNGSFLIGPTDKMVAGATMSEDVGPNGWMYGLAGVNMTGTIAIPSTPKDGPNGTFNVTILSSAFRLGNPGQSLMLDSALIAANGGAMKQHRIGPQVSPDGVQPTSAGGSIVWSFAANVPFSFRVGVGQYHVRVRNDV